MNYEVRNYKYLFFLIDVNFYLKGNKNTILRSIHVLALISEEKKYNYCNCRVKFYSPFKKSKTQLWLICFSPHHNPFRFRVCLKRLRNLAEKRILWFEK